MADPNPPRPAPSATGVLGKTPLLHLLVYALEKKLSGTIELVTQDRRSAVILFAAEQMEGPARRCRQGNLPPPAFSVYGNPAHAR